MVRNLRYRAARADDRTVPKSKKKRSGTIGVQESASISVKYRRGNLESAEIKSPGPTGGVKSPWYEIRNPLFVYEMIRHSTVRV